MRISGVLPARRTLLPFVGGLIGFFAAAGAAAANLGFEAGPVGADAPGWTLAAVDSAAVTDGDDGNDFRIYQTYSISVPPILGEKFLRLGTPKQINESQNRGPNVALSDAFVPAGGDLLLTFEIFSFEHRGDDQVIFEVLDADSLLPLAGTTYTLTPNGPHDLPAMVTAASLAACPAGPVCALTIDAGKRDKRPARSGVYRLGVDLPGTLPEGGIRLRYRVIGGENEAHATWAYFDNENRPPVALLRVNPGGDGPALEGDFVVADCIGTIEPDGDDFSCEYVATGGGINPAEASASGRVAFFWFPDDNSEGQASITLTVRDNLGRESSDTVYLDLRNADPAVNAVDMEVVEGTDGVTVCRWLDAGIGDGSGELFVPETHTVDTTGGTVRPGSSVEEHAPALTTGSAIIEVSGDVPGGTFTCTVTDDDLGWGSDDFTVTVVPTEGLAERDEGLAGNDTVGTAALRLPDQSTVGIIDNPLDVDVYEVCAEIVAGDCLELPTNTELLITLRNLPGDYELLVFGQTDLSELQPFVNGTLKTAPVFNMPVFNMPVFNIPYSTAFFESVPVFNMNFQITPVFNMPVFNIPLPDSPFLAPSGATGNYKLGFTDVLLSSTVARPSAVISSGDVSPTEVGSLNVGVLQATPGVSLKAMSAQQGTQDEQVLVRKNFADQRILVAVVGTDGAFSTTSAYSLSIESALEKRQEEILPPEFCAVEPDPDNPGLAKYAPSWSDSRSVLFDHGEQTLILTQKARYEIEQAETAQAAVDAGEATSVDAFWNHPDTGFWAKVGEYAAAVGGRVVSVDGAFFQAADERPCSVAVRNGVLDAIKAAEVVTPAEFDGQGNLISPAQFTGAYQSLVIVGSMNTFMHRANPDEAEIGKEGDYVTDLWLRPGTPLSVSTAESHNLTDACLVDVETIAYRGRELCLEDIPVARLVESPDQIRGDLDNFLNEASLPNQGEVVFGYDFFCDGTQDIADLINPSNGSFISGPCGTEPPWSADTLRNEALNGGAEMCLVADPATDQVPAPLDLVVMNAHMTTYAALSALGFDTGIVQQAPGFDDVVDSIESRNCLDGAMTATYGCHSGLNVPDDWRVPDELLPFDAGEDWVEEVGGMLAPLTYGLGDNTTNDRCHEGIMTKVFEGLVQGMSWGEATIAAKRNYLVSLGEVDPHDEKCVISLTLYAPPQKVLSGSMLQQASAMLARQSSAADQTALADAGPLQLTVRESDSITGSETVIFDELIDIEENVLFDAGTWYSHAPQAEGITGTARAVYGRPLLPLTIPIEGQATPGPLIHGVALVSRDVSQGTVCPIDGLVRDCAIAARYVDEIPDGESWVFDPVFPLPEHDWIVESDPGNFFELENCIDTLAPTQLGSATTLEQGQTRYQSLLVLGAQFRCDFFDPEVEGSLLGQHRLYTEMEMTAYRPVGDANQTAADRDDDFNPAQFLKLDVIADPSSGSVNATIKATDLLTGNSGIRELIALVYWDAGDGLLDHGVVESYAAVPECTSSPCVLPEEFEYTFLLENAADQKMAFVAVDGAGMIAQKSLKGSLIRPIDVEIIKTLLTVVGDNLIAVRVGDWCNLPNEFTTVEYSVDDGPVTLVALQDDPEGVSVAADADDPCDAIITLSNVDFGDLSGSDAPRALTVKIRMPGAFGQDTASLLPCSDPNEAGVPDNADIIGCGFSTDGGVVVIDMFIAGVPSDDVQYRVVLPDFGLFKYFDGRKTTSPSGTGLSVLEFEPEVPGVGPTQIQFRISRLGNVGWDGVSPILFREETQFGNPGTPTQGFPDETAVFTGEP